MKKTKVISAVAMLLATSALVFTSCGDPDATGDVDNTQVEQPAGDTTDTPKTEDKKEDKKDDKKEDKKEDVDTGSASDLASYTYHKSLISNSFADSWGSGTTITVDGDKVTMVSGNRWNSDVVAGVAGVNYGEIAKYEYIVFTVDTSNCEVSAPEADITSNTGVNIKVPEVLKRPSKYYTVNGKRTYYISTSEFSSASSATSIALIIGGKGTVVLEEFYLAAESEPVTGDVVYANATVYTAGDSLNFESWGVGISAECKDEGIVATGESAYYGVLIDAVQFKAGAKLEVKYTANAAWKIKPVAPEVETTVEAGTDATAVIPLGDNDGTLIKVGLVLGNADVNVTITSIKVIDNE